MVHFQATQELLNKSTPMNGCGCAVARTVNQKLKRKYIFQASYATCCIYDYQDMSKPLQKMETPPNLAAVMKQFDGGMLEEPFEFDLPVREEYIKPPANG